MLNHYKILTVTHRNTSLKNIGKFVIPNSGNGFVEGRLQELKGIFALRELLYLATCNRVMYLFTHQGPLSDEFVFRFFHAVNPGLEAEDLKEVEILEGHDALSHLFEVSASINSLVVGEREILRQLREAYQVARESGLSGDDIRLAMDAAVLAAKEVYANTRIGEKPVSVVSLAMQRLLASGLDRQARIVLIGAGQTNLLVSKFLHKYGYRNVTVYNRSLDKAQRIVDLLEGGEAKPLAELPKHSGSFDCLIVCTGLTHVLVDGPLYRQLEGSDHGRKLVIDLAIPNNVDKNALPDHAHYIEIEDLRAMAKENLAFRERQVVKARHIIEQNLESFASTYRQRQVERTMREVPNQIKAIKSHAINTVFRKEVESLDAETRELLERMMSYMEKKCIGIPMKAAKELALHSDVAPMPKAAQNTLPAEAEAELFDA